MPWSRFEPGFSRHPKRLRCGPLASWLWVCSVDHCTTYRTDGFLDASVVDGLVPGLSAGQRKTLTAALVDVGSWVPTAGGFTVHGYLEHNQTKEQVEHDRQRARSRYEKWKSNGVRNVVATEHPNDGLNVSISQLVSQSVKESENLTTLSGSPPDAAHRNGSIRPPKGKTKLAEARDILAFLNRKAGRNFQEEANLDIIRARLMGGATVGQCRAIIGRKVAQWKDNPDMAQYLRPETLFGRKKFASYLGELPASAFAEEDQDAGMP